MSFVTQSMQIRGLLLFRKIERGFKRLYRPKVMGRLREINLTSQVPICGEGPIVSLTSFGSRVNEVFYAIESIACGTLKPARISLWLEHDIIEQGLPDSLLRLQKRGLDIRGVEDLGPHKKYYPEVMSDRDQNAAFVTADDDTLYPQYWLQTLTSSYQNYPDDIQCFRAHRIVLTEQESLAPYASWEPCLSNEASHWHFSTGSCGVLFPPKMRHALRNLGKEYQDLCPCADDIWLNSVALSSDVKVRQVVWVPKRFYEVPGTRQGALADYNNGKGGNDIQLAKTYSQAALHKLKNG